MKAPDLQHLATRLEIYLLTMARWVSVEEIETACSIPARLMRADGKRRPLYGRFAISSSTKGVKHLSFTNAQERIEYKHARKKVLVANARALRDFDSAIANCLIGKHPAQVERLTGQQTLFPL